MVDFHFDFWEIIGEKSSQYIFDPNALLFIVSDTQFLTQNVFNLKSIYV